LGSRPQGTVVNQDGCLCGGAVRRTYARQLWCRDGNRCGVPGTGVKRVRQTRGRARGGAGRAGSAGGVTRVGSQLRPICWGPICLPGPDLRGPCSLAAYLQTLGALRDQQPPRKVRPAQVLVAELHGDHVDAVPAAVQRDGAVPQEGDGERERGRTNSHARGRLHGTRGLGGERGGGQTAAYPHPLAAPLRSAPVLPASSHQRVRPTSALPAAVPPRSLRRLPRRLHPWLLAHRQPPPGHHTLLGFSRAGCDPVRPSMRPAQPEPSPAGPSYVLPSSLFLPPSSLLPLVYQTSLPPLPSGPLPGAKTHEPRVSPTNRTPGNQTPMRPPKNASNPSTH
jgi:hypothetical protein